MSADLDPRDADLAARLRALGTQPVDPSLQSEHLTALAGVRTGSAFRTSLAGRLKVGAGVLAGVLIGATGLTTAGAMGPLQSISARGVEAVTPLEVASHGKSAEAKAKHGDKDDQGEDETDGTESGPKVLEDGSIGTARNWAGCTPGDGGKFAGNRGLYLKQIRENGTDAELQAAKDSDCGKPLADDEATTEDAPKADDTTATDDDQGGKPADPGAEGKAKAAENKSADHGKSDGAGKSDDAGKPDTTPAASVPDHANDDATTKAPEHTPGTPAGGNAGATSVDS